MLTRVLWKAVLLALTVVWLLGATELRFRLNENWNFSSFRYSKREAPPLLDETGAHQAQARKAHDTMRGVIAAMTPDPAIDVDWFFSSPPQVKAPKNAELQARSIKNPMSSGTENYLWNDALISEGHQDMYDLVEHSTVPDVFVFHSYDGTIFPRFRFHPKTDFAPSNLITNRYGWYSADVTAKKPADVIRIGMIGDSTSQNSYGLYLQGYLNAWAAARHLKVKFEVLNGARQGFGFEDSLAVLKYELAPMGLDYTYMYIAPFVAQQMGEFEFLPDGVTLGDIQSSPSKGIVEVAKARLRSAVKFAEPYSALVRCGIQGASGCSYHEPHKPSTRLRLPHLPAGRTDPDDWRKYSYFDTLFNQLDQYKAVSEGAGARAFVSTERICAYDGMILHENNKGLNAYINGPVFWPFTYRQIRSMIELHNQGVLAWADMTKTTGVDIDGRLPRDPSLCMDAYHDLADSQHMRAWLIFETMLPTIQRDIAAGMAPRRNGPAGDRHPYLDQPPQRLVRAAFLKNSHPAQAAVAQ